MGPLIQRQRYDTPPFTLSKPILRIFEYIKILVRELTMRSISTRVRQEPIILVATDAQADRHTNSGYACTEVTRAWNWLDIRYLLRLVFREMGIL